MFFFKYEYMKICDVQQYRIIYKQNKEKKHIFVIMNQQRVLTGSREFTCFFMCDTSTEELKTKLTMKIL